MCNAVDEVQADLHLGSNYHGAAIIWCVVCKLFLDIVFNSRHLRNFTPSNVSKLPNHAMQDPLIGPDVNLRSQRYKQKAVLQKTPRYAIQITGAKDPRNC